MKLFSLDAEKGRTPSVQMAPLMDIIFIVLIFFMTLSVFYQLETELSITVPEAKEGQKGERTPGEIVINITEEGTIVVNQDKLTMIQLETMLKKVSSLFPNQPVIVRADKKTYHEYVVQVLDACAAANIWNVAFATKTETEE